MMHLCCVSKRQDDVFVLCDKPFVVSLNLKLMSLCCVTHLFCVSKPPAVFVLCDKPFVVSLNLKLMSLCCVTHLCCVSKHQADVFVLCDKPFVVSK